MTVALAGLTIFYCGCSAPPAGDGANTGTDAVTPDVLKQMAADLREEGKVEQAGALEDGDVTREEYLQALENLYRCHSDAGVDLSEAVADPVTGIAMLYFPEASPTLSDERVSEINAECTETYWSYVSAYYVDTHAQAMEPALLAHATECLVEGGLDLAGTEKTLADLAGPDPISADGAESERFQQVSACVTEGMTKLHPEIPFFFMAV